MIYFRQYPNDSFSNVKSLSKHVNDIVRDERIMNNGIIGTD